MHDALLVLLLLLLLCCLLIEFSKLPSNFLHAYQLQNTPTPDSPTWPRLPLPVCELRAERGTGGGEEGRRAELKFMR